MSLSVKNKEAVKLVIVALTIGVTGLVGIYVYRKYIKKHLPSLNKPSEDLGGLNELPAPKPNTEVSTEKSNPFKTKEEISAFQSWVVSKYGKILGNSGVKKDGVDGSWGAKSKSAFEKYGKEYFEVKKITPPVDLAEKLNPVMTAYVVNISTKAIGKNSDYDRLVIIAKKYPKYVENWSKSIDLLKSSQGQRGTTFAFANQVYDSYYGIKRALVNPINKKIVAEKSPTFRRWYATWDSPTFQVTKGKEMGVVSGIQYDKKSNALFLFVPSREGTVMDDYKWVAETSIKYMK